MSKIESRDFWVSDDFIDGVENSIYGETSKDKSDYHCNKITISWQVPERVVTISESEFDKIAAECKYGLTWEEMREKLFKGKE